jgi:hypothetical protein
MMLSLISVLFVTVLESSIQHMTMCQQCLCISPCFNIASCKVKYCGLMLMLLLRGCPFWFLWWCNRYVTGPCWDFCVILVCSINSKPVFPCFSFLSHFVHSSIWFVLLNHILFFAMLFCCSYLWNRMSLSPIQSELGAAACNLST